MALNLVNTYNIGDDGTLLLNGATAVTTAVVGGTTYVFVAGASDDGISVFSLAPDGTLTFADSVADTENGLFELDGVGALATAVIGGTTYLFAGGYDDNGFSMFSVGADGALTSVDNKADVAGLQLSGLSTLSIMQSSGKTFLYAGGSNDNGFTAFDVSAGTIVIVPTGGKVDDPALEIQFPSVSCLASIGGRTFLFVNGELDDGISVFSLDPITGLATNTDNVTDGALRNLKAVDSLTTGVVAGKTFLFAAGLDHGISVFSVSNQGFLDNVFNLSDDAAMKLANVDGLATATIGGTTYLFAAGHVENGISAFAVAPDGTLINVANIGDDSTLKLGDVSSLSTVVVGGKTFLLATASGDDGVSVFRLDGSGLTVNGTAGNDVVNALTTPAGQLLPGDFGDTISGFGGNDNLSGLSGDDTINGGSGNDTLVGGAGKDLLRGQAGRDTFDFNTTTESNGVNADTIEGFSHAQGDRIDLRTIDAMPGGINNAFLFAGTQSFAAFNATHSGGVVRAVAGIVQVDIGGDGTVDMVIKTPGATLHAGDFLL